MANQIILVEELKDLKPVNNSFGLEGKIIKDGVLEAHIKEERYDSKERALTGDAYSYICDWYAEGKMLKEDFLSSNAHEPYLCFAETFLMLKC